MVGTSPHLLMIFLLIILSFFSETESTTVSFGVVNKCNYTVWPGILSAVTLNPPLSTAGFMLLSGEFYNFSVPQPWKGQVWGRTFCAYSSAGNFSCFTADCGTGKIDCNGTFTPKSPVTLAEFDFNRTDGLGSYTVNLQSGFNIPMAVEPGSGNCSSPECTADINGACPASQRVARDGEEGSVACMTPCTANNYNLMYCCDGLYLPLDQKCEYMDYFRESCPEAYSDGNSTKDTCASSNYSVVFCPGNNNTTTHPKTSLDQQPETLGPIVPPNKPETLAPVAPPKLKDGNIGIIIVASVVSSISGVVIITSAVLACLWNRKRKRGIHKALELEDGRRFTFSELVKITKNFTSSIGAGGFGEVYHGVMENGDQVAVKLLKSASGSNQSNEFQNEVKLLMRAHHKNVVSFIGYCNDGKNMALVFTYVANGNLQQHLLTSDIATGKLLTWKERLQIAVDAAHGLDYLHNDCKPPIIHRDIKTSNILLTEKMRAKICDFGVSKLLSTETATHTMTDHVKGTRGYYDPEYYNTGKLNKKSDIYSFGVVLLELITGKTAIMKDGELEAVHICHWLRPIFQRRDIEAMLDSRIQEGDYDVSSAWKAIEIAMECVSSTAIERPDINAVYKEPKECLEIEVPPEIPIAPEIDESESDESDDCSSSSSVPALMMSSHTRSESFIVHMKSNTEYETDIHSC